MRTRTHKLSYAFTGDGELAELRDLTCDPHEYRYVVDEPAYAGVLAALQRRLLDWWIASQQPPNFAASDECFPPTRWLRPG